jgi:hypothetical protein
MKDWRTVISARRAVKATLAVFVLVCLPSCNILEAEVADFGFVKLTVIEVGDCWVIETSDETYLPTLLPSNLRVEGLRVQFEASNRLDLSNPCPGTIIELIWIEASPE